MTYDSIPHRFMNRVRAHAKEPAYFRKENGMWHATSWGEYGALVRKAAASLIALGVQPGEATCVLGFNRPEWLIMDVATMCAGAAPAGIYTTCSASEVRYIVHHAEAKVVLVENEAQFAKIAKERENLPLLKQVVLMNGAHVNDPLACSWEQFLEMGNDIAPSEIDRRIDALKAETLATLIYTSGTTGPPKGVMLSHQNLAWTADAAITLTSATSADSVLSYLPLSHIAEQMFTVHGPITAGIPVYFAESIDKVPENLKEVRPSILFAVPRIWEKFHAGIRGKLGESEGAKKAIGEWARSIGRKAAPYRLRGRAMPRALDLQYRLAQKLVFSKVKEAIGLDRARICVSGAAPIAKDVLEFLSELDILVQEVYGQSEGTGPTSFNFPGNTKLGTVGTAIPGDELRIMEDGEIWMRGPNVFLGYHKEEAATRETLSDGWLLTGDLGAIDDEGFLSITGRKKELIITAGGKNIAPKNIEEALKSHPLIHEAIVIGDRRKFLSALVTLCPDHAPKFAKEKNIDVNTMHTHPMVQAEVQRAVDAVNAELARVEQVKKFHVLTRTFSLAHGEITPTLKLKRSIIAKNFSVEIEAMYEGA